jgi:hypothetical protein
MPAEMTRRKYRKGALEAARSNQCYFGMLPGGRWLGVGSLPKLVSAGAIGIRDWNDDLVPDVIGTYERLEREENANQ